MSDMRKFMNLMEDGEASLSQRPSNPEITYQDEDTRVVAYLKSFDSQSYTKLAQKIEKATALKKELAEMEKEIKALGREKVGDLFAAGDAVKTRVVDTCSFILTLNKDSAPTTTVKYAEVIKELTNSLTPELITVLETLKSKYSSVTQKASALSIEKKPTESINEGLWDSVQAFAAKLLAKVQVWGAKYDNKLNALKSKLAVSESLDGLNDPTANSVWESPEIKSPWMMFAESKEEEKAECDCGECKECVDEGDKGKTLEESLAAEFDALMGNPKKIKEWGSSPYDKVGKNFAAPKATPYDRGMAQNQGTEKSMDEPALISTWQTHEGTKVYIWRAVQGGREVISMVNSGGKKLPWHREPKNYSDAMNMLKTDYEYTQVANQKELSLEADEPMDDQQGLTEYDAPDDMYPVPATLDDAELDSYFQQWKTVRNHLRDPSDPETMALMAFGKELEDEARSREWRVEVDEAPKKKPEIPIKEVKYGAWTIKAKLKPEADGKTFKAMGSHPRNPNAPIGQGMTSDEAIRNVQQQIDKHMEHDQRALGASKATVDYNAAFTNTIVKDNSEFSAGATGVRITRQGGEVVLILCGAEYLDAFGPEVYGTGPDQFTKLHVRMGGSGDAEDGKASKLYSSSLTGKQIQSLGLQPNGRYTLEYLSHDRDYGHLTFKLVFDSIVGDKSERVSMAEPGLNIAVS